MANANEPVENPELVAAIDRLATNPSEENKEALMVQLRQATYLAAALMDELRLTADPAGDTATVEEGSSLKFFADKRDGKTYLILFTDWRSLRAYIKDEVTGYVLPAAVAWDFVLQGFDAAVINPAHNALPLNRGLIEYLRDG